MSTSIQYSPKFALFYFQHGGTCRMLNMIQLLNLGIPERQIKQAMNSDGEIQIGAFSLAHPNRES